MGQAGFFATEACYSVITKFVYLQSRDTSVCNVLSTQFDEGIQCDNPATVVGRTKMTIFDTWGPIYKISYDNLMLTLTIMPKLRSTYNIRLIYKTSYNYRKTNLR